MESTVEAREKRRLWDMTHQEVCKVAGLAIGNDTGAWVVKWIESIGWSALCMNSRRTMCVFLMKDFNLRTSCYGGRDNWILIPTRGQKNIYKYLIDIGVLKMD